MYASTDIRYMRIALSLARRHLGRTWPNPCVGALVVKDGRILGQGITAPGGRPHAEPQALAQAGTLAKGATLYVTLEPCSHHGKTPPCADAVITAGITRCVIGHSDPNPAVSGGGVHRLREAGIEVIEDVAQAEAAIVNEGFFSLMRRHRPFIALKLATSLDGKMATATGESQWITGPAARRYAHLLRSRYDAIATGIGTVLADDPLLTCRLPGMEHHSPVRLVFDRQNRLPPESALMRTAAEFPVWETDLMLEPAIDDLAQRGVTRLLVEAGPKLSTAFLLSGLVDRVYWLRAPMLMGNNARAAALPGFSDTLAELRRYRRSAARPIGDDMLEVYEAS